MPLDWKQMKVMGQACGEVQDNPHQAGGKVGRVDAAQPVQPIAYSTPIGSKCAVGGTEDTVPGNDEKHGDTELARGANGVKREMDKVAVIACANKGGAGVVHDDPQCGDAAPGIEEQKRGDFAQVESGSRLR